MEWQWVAIWTLIALISTCIPYAVGYASSTEIYQFSGFVFALNDMNSYIAKMRHGATYPGWLFQMVYTLEPHRAGIIFAFYLTLGKVAALFTGKGANVATEALVITFHISRVIFGAVLLWMVYRFVSFFFKDVRLRRLAWALAVFSSGLGWLGLFFADGFTPVFVFIPEAFTWLQLFALPHLALARVCFLGGWLLLFTAIEQSSTLKAIFAGVLWLTMGVIVPFYTALLGVLVAVWLTIILIVERPKLWVALKMSVVSGSLPVVVLIYYGWLFTSDPVLATWSSQNQLISPPLWHYALAFGLLIILAVYGVIHSLPTENRLAWLLMVAWVPIVFVLVYLPINVQRRLLEGVILPLAVLATLGVTHLVRILGLPSKRGWSLMYGVLSLATLPGILLLLLGTARVVQSTVPPAFNHRGVSDAAHWLKSNVEPGSTLLSTFDSGNSLPAYAPVRVFVGHGPETVDSLTKTELAEQFFLVQ